MARAAKTSTSRRATSKGKRVLPSKPARPDLDKTALLKLYRDMLLIRRFEEKAGQLYGQGMIAGF
ncbi:MAG: pyruvate dehydrogenase (acetyl-transferring) E1 component subunit alpha, partial [Alphaproteobacteria bacterium]